MATPVIESTSDQNGSGLSGLTYTMPTPSGLTSGELLLVFISSNDTSASPISMSGFVKLYGVIQETFITGAFFYRISDGTEGANVVATLTAAEQTCAKLYRISGYSGVPEVEVVGVGNNTNQTPPPITPTGGSSDYLYLTIDNIDTLISVNTFPTGYINTGTIQSGPSGSQCMLAFAEKSTLATTSETPSDFIISATRRAVVATIAIQASGGGGVSITVDFDVKKPIFSASIDNTPVNNASSVGFTTKKPSFSVNVQNEDINNSTSANFTTKKPSFSVSINNSVGGNVSSVDFTVKKPVFSVSLDNSAGSNQSSVNFTTKKPLFSATINNETLPNTSVVNFSTNKPVFSVNVQNGEVVVKFNEETNYTQPSLSTSYVQPHLSTNYTQG